MSRPLSKNPIVVQAAMELYRELVGRLTPEEIDLLKDLSDLEDNSKTFRNLIVGCELMNEKK